MQKKSLWPVVWKLLCTFFLLATVVFIFYNSSRIGSVSGNISRRVMDAANGFFESFGMGFRLSHTLIRKLGHFGEYALLGVWLMLALRVYTGRIIAYVSWPLLAGLLVAVADEFYQGFVPGRSSEVRDVIIDFGGVFFGLVATLAGIALVTSAKRALFGRKQVTS